MNMNMHEYELNDKTVSNNKLSTHKYIKTIKLNKVKCKKQIKIYTQNIVCPKDIFKEFNYCFFI